MKLLTRKHREVLAIAEARTMVHRNVVTPARKNPSSHRELGAIPPLQHPDRPQGRGSHTGYSGVWRALHGWKRQFVSVR